MPVEYSYRLKPGLVLLGILFFGMGALMMQDKARANDRGLVIDMIIRLDVAQATIFYNGMALLFAGFVVLLLVKSFCSQAGSGKLRLTANELVVPDGIFQKDRTVSFHTISGLRIIEIRRTRFLKIRSSSGTVLIHQSMLPDGAFEAVYATLARRIRDKESGIAPVAQGAPVLPHRASAKEQSLAPGARKLPPKKQFGRSSR